MPKRPGDLGRELSDTDFQQVGREILQEGVVPISARATTTYMRTGGTGVSARNSQTGQGALRLQSGRLARSLTGARSAQPTPGSIRSAPEGVFDLSPTSNGVRLTYGSKVPYAAAHEYGFQGSVQIERHKRRMTQGFGPSSAYPQTVSVRAHSRQMDIPKRPYLEPALSDSLSAVQSIAEEKLRDALFGGGSS